MVGIISNNAALSAQANLKKASEQSSLSIARLSSGNKIIRASDDVSGLAVGTVLRTNVSTLKTALTSASQAGSLLQVADGGLSNIGEILQRMKSLAVSANSGTLSDNERAFLNEEFQNLIQEQDRTVASTAFNGQKLLDGGLFNKAAVETSTAAGVQATGAITFTAAVTNADTVTINGVAFTFTNAAPAATTDVAMTGAASTEIDGLIAAINATIASSSTSDANRNALLAAKYTKVGNTLVVTSNVAGIEGNRFTLAEGLTAGTVSASTLTGGVEGALTSSRTSISGTVGDSIVRDASGTRASAVIELETAVPANNDTITVNGVTFTFKTTVAAANDIDIGATQAATAANFVAVFNASTSDAVKGLVASSSNEFITIRSDVVGSAGNSIAIAGTFATATNLEIVGAATVDGSGTATTLTGGATDANIGGTKASGSVSFSSVPSSGDTVTVGGVAFTFKSAATYTGVSTDILIGSSLYETLDNAVGALNNVSGNMSAANQLTLGVASYQRVGNTLQVNYKTVGTNGNGFTIAASAATASGANLTGGTSTIAVDTTNISNNSGFNGTIQGFNAIYNGTPDKVTLEVVVGDYTYSGIISDTTPRSGATVRLSSVQSGGGYFEFDLAGGNGQSVSSQTDADVFASRINKAFSTLTFAQNRDVSSFNAIGDILTNSVKTGSLVGASVDFSRAGYDDVNVESVSVAAPVNGATDGVIEMVVNGETFRSTTGIGSGTIGFTLVSQTDPKNTISLNLKERTTFSTDAEAKSFQTALENAFGLKQGGGGLNFQIGIAASDSITVALQDARSTAIYKDNNGDVQTLDITTTAGAQQASEVLDNAIKAVVTLRSTVGALQSRFGFAATNLQTAIQNTDAARGDFLDANIEQESTDFAQSQVRLQASIAVLAQANQLTQNILKLIG